MHQLTILEVKIFIGDEESKLEQKLLILLCKKCLHRGRKGKNEQEITKVFYGWPHSREMTSSLPHSSSSYIFEKKTIFQDFT